MEEEVWKDIPNYESLYSVSSLGRVFSKKSSKMLSTKVSKGYSRLTLYQNKIKKRVFNTQISNDYLSWRL